MHIILICAIAQNLKIEGGDSVPWGFGWGWRWRRGWRFWYRVTGMPGWMRASYGLPAFGLGWGWRCRWFPWLPRWWWTGIYGPVRWTPQGPVLESQLEEGKEAGLGEAPATTFQVTPSAKDELEALKEERRMLEEELKFIERKIKELERMRRGK